MYKSIIAALLLFTCTGSFAKAWQVEMLNYGKQGGMVFEPAFIHAQVGDSVTFIATHSGHNAQSYLVPEGEKQWKSSIDERYTLQLNQQGVHFYYCPPHLMMGMIGMIQVGEALNIDILREKSPRLRSKVALKPERVDELIQQLIIK